MLVRSEVSYEVGGANKLKLSKREEREYAKQEKKRRSKKNNKKRNVESQS